MNIYLDRRKLRELVWQIDLTDDLIIVHGQHLAAFLHTCTALIIVRTVPRARTLPRHDVKMTTLESETTNGKQSRKTVTR